MKGEEPLLDKGLSTYLVLISKMGCFNDPAWKACGWWGGDVVGWWRGGVADTNYLYPARWGWINNLIFNWSERSLCTMRRLTQWPLLALLCLLLLISPCVYFSRRSTFTRVLNFCMKLILKGNNLNFF